MVHLEEEEVIEQGYKNGINIRKKNNSGKESEKKKLILGQNSLGLKTRLEDQDS